MKGIPYAGLAVSAAFALLAGIQPGRDVKHLRRAYPLATTEQQAARIEAAQAKRDRRASIAYRNAVITWARNPCLSGADRFNPTYVNRSE